MEREREGVGCTFFAQQDFLLEDSIVNWILRSCNMHIRMNTNSTIHMFEKEIEDKECASKRGTRKGARSAAKLMSLPQIDRHNNEKLLTTSPVFPFALIFIFGKEEF